MVQQRAWKADLVEQIAGQLVERRGLDDEDADSRRHSLLQKIIHSRQELGAGRRTPVEAAWEGVLVGQDRLKRLHHGGIASAVADYDQTEPLAGFNHSPAQIMVLGRDRKSVV